MTNCNEIISVKESTMNRKMIRLITHICYFKIEECINYQSVEIIKSLVHIINRVVPNKIHISDPASHLSENIEETNKLVWQV